MAQHKNAEGRLIHCPKCKGVELWRVGTLPTMREIKVRYKCTKCGKVFTPVKRKHIKTVSIRPSDFVDDEK